MTIKEAKKTLRQIEKYSDDEHYHYTFDSIIEERLMELDPTFMKAMADEYQESEMCRWCA